MTTEERLVDLERELKAAKWELAEIKTKMAGVSITGGFMVEDLKGEWQGTRDLTGYIWLKDEKGQIQVMLSQCEGGPMLWLLGKNGRLRIALSVVEDVPELALRDEEGKERLVLSVDKEGPRLRLRDEQGNVRAALSMTPNGEPRLAVLNAAGDVVWSAP